MKAKNQETPALAGDGVTDDTAALQARADATGRLKDLPAGEYKVNGELVLGNERLTAAQWADRKGIGPKVDPARPWLEPVAKSTRECPLGIHYHAADVLHGWSHHAYNFQAPADALLMLEADFDAALAAAAGYPACNAHMAAVAPHAPFRAELEARAAAEAKDKP